MYVCVFVRACVSVGGMCVCLCVCVFRSYVFGFAYVCASVCVCDFRLCVWLCVFRRGCIRACLSFECVA